MSANEGVRGALEGAEGAEGAVWSAGSDTVEDDEIGGDESMNVDEPITEVESATEDDSDDAESIIYEIPSDGKY